TRWSGACSTSPVRPLPTASCAERDEMDEFEFQAFRSADEGAWNALVAASPNGTFLLDRRFMGYHADRFEDASLLIARRGKLVAVLPANRQGERVASHAGLSYG